MVWAWWMMVVKVEARSGVGVNRGGLTLSSVVLAG